MSSPVRSVSQKPEEDHRDGGPGRSAPVNTSMQATEQTTIVIPPSYYDVDISILVDLVAGMLTRVVEINDNLQNNIRSITRFHSRAPPQISVRSYLERIVKYANLEPSCLLLLLIYVDRICERNRLFNLSSLTVHRFIIAAITVACKSVCDSYFTNAHYAKVGGVTTKELNSLEVELVSQLGWHLVTTHEQLLQYYSTLAGQSLRYTIIDDAPPRE